MSLRVKDIPHSYEQAISLLNMKIRNPIRNVSSNGYLYWWDKIVYLKLYETVIVKYYPNGDMWIDCGSYPTVTTQHWVNIALDKYTSRYIFRENGRLFVSLPNKKYAKCLPCLIKGVR